MKVQIDLGFNWKVGKLGLNEIVYRVDELAPQILTQVVEQLAEAYQNEGCETPEARSQQLGEDRTGATRGQGAAG